MTGRNKTGRNETGFQAVKKNGKTYQYFYGVQVLWDGYDLAKSREENDEENYVRASPIVDSTVFIKSII